MTFLILVSTIFSYFWWCRHQKQWVGGIKTSYTV